MLSLFLAVALQGPDLDKKVTFASVAKPVRRILEEITPKAGFPLLASTVVGEEVIIVRLNDVSIGEAMKKIASATNAEWQQEQGGFRLVRTPAKAQQEEQEAIARRTDGIRKALQKMLSKGSNEPLTAAKAEEVSKSILKLRTRTDDAEFDFAAWNQITRLEQSTASGRLMHKLLTMMDPRELAMIEAGTRVVFSTSPNAMQRPFRGNARTALAAYAADHAVWVEVAKRASDGKNDPEEFSSWSMSYLEPLQAGVKKAIVAIMSEGYAEGMHLELKVFDEKDRLVGQLSQGLTDFDELEIAAMIKRGQDPKTSGTAIELSELSKQMAAVLASKQKSGGAPVEVSEPLRQAILNPEEHDPHSMIVSDAILGVAKVRSKNLVAALADDIVPYLGYFGHRKELTDDIVMSLLKNTQMMRLEEDERWMLVSPAEPVRARQTFIDRQALGTFLRASAAKGLVAIDDAAKLALAIKDPNGGTSLVTFALSLVAADGEEQWSESDLNLLRLYGTMNAAQRLTLKQGGRMIFGQMSAAQKLYLNRIVFGRYSNFDLTDEAQISEEGSEGLWALMQEPTEMLPNGVHPSGFLTLKSEDRSVLFAYAGEQGWSRTMTTEELAWDMVYRDDPERHPWMRNQPQYNQFRSGNQLQLNFTFRLTEQVNTQGELRQNAQAATSKLVGFNQLPPSVRADVEKKIAEYKKMFEEMPRGTGNRKPPPPPQ